MRDAARAHARVLVLAALCGSRQLALVRGAPAEHDIHGSSQLRLPEPVTAAVAVKPADTHCPKLHPIFHPVRHGTTQALPPTAWSQLGRTRAA